MAEPPATGAKFVVDGNDLCGAAASWRLRLLRGYPITPSSEIMHFLAREIWKHGGTLLQAEDEIAASRRRRGIVRRKKAMTATSGPGMSLKTRYWAWRASRSCRSCA